jgi:hypothetical protein
MLDRWAVAARICLLLFWIVLSCIGSCLAMVDPPSKRPYKLSLRYTFFRVILGEREKKIAHS